MRKLILCGGVILITLFAVCQDAASQVIARFTVKDVQNVIAAPVHINLDKLTYLPDSAIHLLEVREKEKVPVPFQIENGEQRLLWWMVRKEGKSPNRIFELVKGDAPQMKPVISFEKEDGGLIVKDEGKKVLRYNYQVAYPPEGMDSAFRRSGFIHPLWSPDGTVLTRINPWDHPHHYGIWNPWTNVLFQGKNVDFWNLKKGQGTVRFAKFISKTSGAVFGGFKVLQEHVAFDSVKGQVKETVVMDEVWDIKAYSLGPKMWLWDFTSVLNCATPDPVLLEKYTYGGFGFRATEEWNGKNSQALTSEGKDRNNGNNTRARWCMIDGKSNDGRSGILFMSYPRNYNSPEPMRIYPQNWFNGSGDLFFSFSPTMTTADQSCRKTSRFGND